jgi:hypothetical protein
METSEGVIVRLNPETDEVVGFTILDFSRRFAESAASTLSIPLSRQAANSRH